MSDEDGSAGCFEVEGFQLVDVVTPNGLRTKIERTPWIIPRGREVWKCRGCPMMGSSHAMLWHRCSDVRVARRKEKGT